MMASATLTTTRTHRNRRASGSEKHGEGSLSETAMPQPLLSVGASGSAVLELQRKLQSCGFNPNGLDGDFGPGTLAAVRAFQQAKGLSTDGVVGPNTWAALDSFTQAAPVTGGSSALLAQGANGDSVRAL